MNKKIKLGFPLDRSPAIKTYAPILIEALKRNIEVFLLCGPDPFNSYPKNRSYRPLKENINFPNIYKTSIIYFKSKTDLPKIIEKHKITDIVSYPFTYKTYESSLENIKKIGTKIHMLQWYADFLVTTPLLINDSINTIFVYSNNEIETYKEAYPNITEKITKKFIPIGFIPAESLNYIASKELIKLKYKIPENKKIVTLMTVPVASNDPFWLHSVFNEPNRLLAVFKCIKNNQWKYVTHSLFYPNYNNIVKSIKKWCHKNNYFFIIKNKAKYEKSTSQYNKEADLVIKDSSEKWFPQTIFEIAKLSDIVINFISSGTYDIIASNTFNISINLMEIDMTSKPSYFFKKEIYEYKGVSVFKNYKEIGKFLENSKLENFTINKNNQKKYIKKYLGQNDRQASKRIIDYILKNS